MKATTAYQLGRHKSSKRKKLMRNQHNKIQKPKRTKYYISQYQNHRPHSARNAQHSSNKQHQSIQCYSTRHKKTVTHQPTVPATAIRTREQQHNSNESQRAEHNSNDLSATIKRFIIFQDLLVYNIYHKSYMYKILEHMTHN